MRRLPRTGRGGRSRLRRLADVLGVMALLAVSAVAAVLLEEYSMREVSGAARVVDGDTMVIGGERIRLAGIDAPELDQQCVEDGAAFACGEKARTHLAGLLGEGDIFCRGNERDRYGRLLMRCMRGDIDINSEMVRSGWAVAYGDYLGQERTAKSEDAGLWAGDFEAPERWRAQRGAIADIGPAGPAALLRARFGSFFGATREEKL